MNAPAARSTATDLGRYEVLFRLASGGMAEVFVARQRGEGGFERVVAIKRMLAHLADDERFVAMFLDEARLAAYISSPHVVQTLDVDVDDSGSPFIVMDLVIGLTLAQTLRAAGARKAFIPAAAAVEILAQSADGLHDAHEAVTPTGLALQIVHRDVSPQNTLIGVDGRVRIMDFGVARALARITKTSTGEFKGKISYFSPEQAEGRELDRRSDIFSHGIVAWETFTGSRLFKSDNPLSVLDAIRNQQIPLVSDLRPDVPEAVARVVAKALERDVSKRYQTAREFSRDLRRAAEATLSESPEPRLVGAYVRDVSGSVLDQMQQRISDAFARASSVDAEGRVSLVGSGTNSKLRFMRNQGELEELSSEPPPSAIVDDDGAPAPSSSNHPTVIGNTRTGASAASASVPHASIANASSVDQVSAAPDASASKRVAIVVGAVALVGAGALFAYGLMKPKPQLAAPEAPVAQQQQQAPAAAQTQAQQAPAQPAAAPLPEQAQAPAPSDTTVPTQPPAVEETQAQRANKNGGGRIVGATVRPGASQAAPTTAAASSTAATTMAIEPTPAPAPPTATPAAPVEPPPARPSGMGGRGPIISTDFDDNEAE